MGVVQKFGGGVGGRGFVERDLGGGGGEEGVGGRGLEEEGVGGWRKKG